MTIQDIVANISGKIVEGEEHKIDPIDCAFSSDLMSDVLTIKTDRKIMLITGLANTQAIRTCEMSDIRVILFARGKKVTEEMIELGKDNEMVLIETPLSMYRVSGILFNLGLSPVY